MRRSTAIALAGIALLASFILILADDFGQEWKHVQSRFMEIKENAYHSSATNPRPSRPGVQQIVSEGLDRVDRCTTCHLGIDDKRYANAEPPFRTHPGDLLKSHDIKRFGCTACHFGQGYAVSYDKAAHKKLPFWNETMLPPELLEASCGTCHLSVEVPRATVLSRGRLLIKDKGCAGCHEINKFFEEEKLGPDLGGIGNKVTRGWLYNWLKNPRDYLEHARMPSFRFTEDQLTDLVEYLMGFAGKSSPPHPITALPSEAGDADRGKILISQSRCITCHTIEGRGGKLAPELARVGDKVREDWLANFLRNIHYYQPSKKMLAYNFTDQDALDVAAYMLEEYSEDSYVFPPDTIPGARPLSHTQKREQVTAGRKLFAKFGCAGCHTIPTSHKFTKVGPKLDNIGNRLESKLDFGNHDDIVPTVYNWIFMKIKDPTVFDSTRAMPNFFLSDAEAFEITVALLGNRQNNYATEYLVRETEHSLYKKPAGEFGHLFERYSCISCHSIDKYGGTISTVSLTIEGSKVQSDWLRKYLLKPFAIRPILTERMPRFRMTEREAALMADYIKRVYVSDDIPTFMQYDLTSQQAKAGKILFDSLACTNCHIINGKGGYVGPDLDNTGARLEAGWVYTWLHNPGKYRPGTIHPDFGFSDAQARQLTAYLMTKRRASR